MKVKELIEKLQELDQEKEISYFMSNESKMSLDIEIKKIRLFNEFSHYVIFSNENSLKYAKDMWEKHKKGWNEICDADRAIGGMLSQSSQDKKYK